MQWGAIDLVELERRHRAAQLLRAVGHGAALAHLDGGTDRWV